LFEPVNLVLTPLLFFFLGMAGTPVADMASRSTRMGTRPLKVRRSGRVLVGITLAVALVVSLLMITAATLERWGKTYGEEWAYRAALRVQPWRVSATADLATLLALDGRGGNAAAASEARDLMTHAVDDHPWDVNLRPRAADVDTLLRDPAGSSGWIREQLARFPGDAAGLAAAAETAQLP
jgi:hypothetical protein